MTMMPEASISTDVCTVATVRRIAAMLDLDSDMFVDGRHCPAAGISSCWAARHDDPLCAPTAFPVLAFRCRISACRDCCLRGVRVEYRSDLVIGSPIHRRSALTNVTRKQTASGEMAVVTIHHELASER